MKFGHINIKTKDLDKSKEFYTSNLNGRVLSEHETTTFKRAMVICNGILIELMEKKNYVEVSSGVIDHIAFYVDSLDQIMHDLDRANVERFTPEPFETLGLKIMFYLGPDGEKLEFMEVISLPIDDQLSLIKAKEGDYANALPWYSNEVVLKGSENRQKAYTMDEIMNMYSYLSNRGELYFIQYNDGKDSKLIGDAAILPDSLPIVIGLDEFRGLKIASRVLKRLVERGYELGRETLYVKEIYDFNEASQSLYTSQGFVKDKKTDNGYSYKLVLNR